MGHPVQVHTIQFGTEKCSISNHSDREGAARLNARYKIESVLPLVPESHRVLFACYRHSMDAVDTMLMRQESSGD